MMKCELPRLVRLGREVCGDLARAEQHEWWLSNGKGGYAGGTVAGTLTRRYHGLLVAPLQANLQRQLLFAKADVELLEGREIIPLHTNRWGSGAIEPRGYLHIESFFLEGRMPVWHYRCDDLLIEARIWMEHGRHSTCLAWRLLENPAEREVCLRVRLMANVRDHHGTTESSPPIQPVKKSSHELDVNYADAPTLHFHSRCGEVELAHFFCGRLRFSRRTGARFVQSGSPSLRGLHDFSNSLGALGGLNRLYRKGCQIFLYGRWAAPFSGA